MLCSRCATPNHHRILRPRDPHITTTHVGHCLAVAALLLGYQIELSANRDTNLYQDLQQALSSQTCLRLHQATVRCRVPQEPVRSGPTQDRICGIMAHPSGSGGTSIAPTPTHPHHLSREASKDDVEMAESLRRMNQPHATHPPRIATPLHVQRPASTQETARSEIYHSLEDAVPISAGPATPATPSSFPSQPGSVIGANAPISGQTCRYVCRWLAGLCSSLERTAGYTTHTDKSLMQ